jgi:membrane protease YdiL (CAAX protease family)
MRSAQIFVAFLGISLIGGLLLRPLQNSPFASLPLYFGVLIAVLLLSKVPVWGKWISLRTIGISKENLGRHVLWGVGAAFANAPILVVVMLISTQVFKGLPSPEHPTTVELTTTSNPWVIVVSVLLAAVMAPIIEEIMFRGTMFPGFSRAFNSPIWGGVASSLIFAAIHPTGIPAWPALAAIGGMSCFLVYQTRSLVPSMVMHATHNFGTLVLVLLTTR